MAYFDVKAPSSTRFSAADKMEMQDDLRDAQKAR